MAHEQLRSTTATRTLADVVGDLTVLLQKELQLARAEVSANFAAKLHVSLWMAVGSVFAGLALFLALQALVFGVASYGVPIHWSCLIVAGAAAVLAALAFFVGRTHADRPLMPQKTIHQLKQDVNLSKEQLT